MVGHVQELEIGARAFEHAGQIGAPGGPGGSTRFRKALIAKRRGTRSTRR